MSGTDSDTESSCWEEDIELPSDVNATYTPQQVTQSIWWAYQKAKGAWRKHTGKPVRAVRRFVRKQHYLKNRGKGQAFNSTAFLAAMSDYDITYTFINKGRGKGGLRGMTSTGKGKGRRTNPIGKDGSVMWWRGSSHDDMHPPEIEERRQF